MKILMLHNRYLVPGGEDQSAAAEAALLARHGHEVELLEEDNKRVEILGKAGTAMRTVWSRESQKRVENKLHSGRFDILHVQNFFPLWSPSVYYAASRCGVPVVQTLRNYRLICSNAIFFRENRVCEDCLGRFAPWPGILHGCYRDSRAASSVVAAMIGAHKIAGTWRKQVNTYIALTDFAREKYIAGGLPAEKIIVKPNFVDPAPSPGSGGGGYALFIGRLSAEKGLATMIEAWKTADGVLPLKIAGDGPLLELVKAAAASNPSIQYLGRTAPEDTLELMRRAEFLVFPSGCYEAMPRTVIEAFAVGTPVLASDIGATASMVMPEETGFHFAPGNVTELREKAEWCSRNLLRMRAMREKARAAFEARYTGAANVGELLSIYGKAQETRLFSRSVVGVSS
ncbi:MAG TPA: glycosyltransferase family 4 protein [Candidatus Angelobacter sp.]|nr:glycosyltransferase family 4 protein [Candidatus Angelobacter sp.]